MFMDRISKYIQTVLSNLSKHTVVVKMMNVENAGGMTYGWLVEKVAVRHVPQQTFHEV